MNERVSEVELESYYGQVGPADIIRIPTSFLRCCLQQLDLADECGRCVAHRLDVVITLEGASEFWTLCVAQGVLVQEQKRNTHGSNHTSRRCRR